MGSITTLVDGNIKATFTAGVVPTRIEFLLDSKPPLRIGLVETAIEVTWYQATRNLWFQFNSKPEADQAAELLQDTKLMGINLLISVKPSKTGKIWAVQVSNVTDAIECYQLLAALPADAKPTATASGDWSNGVDTPDLQVIDNLIASINEREVKCIRMLKRSNPLKYKAEFRLEGCQRLDGLARQLNGKLVPEFGDSKLFAVERVDLRLSLRRVHYERHSIQLRSAARELWLKEKVQIHIDESTDSTSAVNIHLRATNRKALTTAKATLDAILIHEVCGPLTSKLKTSAPQTHRIRLTKATSYRDVLVGGLKRATDAFGPDIITFDDGSDPPAIVVKGDTAMLRKVQKCLRRDKPLPESKTVRCAICWDNDVEDAVRVGECGHVACKDCFVQYCTVDVAAKSPLRCFQSECHSPIPMHQLQSALNRPQFQSLLSETIASHFTRKPEEYSPCLGADCGAYYRTSEAGDQHTCPRCFTTMCPSCKVEYHFDETCEQYQLRVNDHVHALEQWMEAEGAKHCQRCNAIVQKAEGCDNMQCHFCKADFCWKCMEIFPSHNAVYAHMMEKHGGYGDEEVELDDIQGDAMARAWARVEGFPPRPPAVALQGMNRPHAVREFVDGIGRLAGDEQHLAIGDEVVIARRDVAGPHRAPWYFVDDVRGGGGRLVPRPLLLHLGLEQFNAELEQQRLAREARENEEGAAW